MEHTEELTTTAEESAEKKDIQEFYRVTRTQAGKTKRPARKTFKKKQLTLTTPEEQTMARTLQRAPQPRSTRTESDNNTSERDLPITTRSPARTEFNKANVAAKNTRNSVAQIEYTTALRVDVDRSAAMLYGVFEGIWNGQQTPQKP